MEEQKRKHPFGKGLLCGLLAGVLITGLAGSVVIALGGFTEASAKRARIDHKIDELERYIDRYYLFDYEEADVESGVYKGLMAGLGDPYTGYYTAQEYASFMESSNGAYSGIGAVLSQNMSTGIITVVQVFEGSPAEEAGVQAEDILYKVAGKEVTGEDLSLVVTDLKGEEGTDVHISVVRETEELEMDITRRHIEIPTISYEMLTDEIGYITISEFDDVTDDQFFLAMDDLEAQGMKDLVIDLRNNGGGLVDVTCNILDRLLPEGLIVYTEDKDGNREEAYSDAENYFDGDMAVLVNGNSASASEIFAGAVKDYGVGTLIGTQTFGKGIVQSLFPLVDGDAVKITVSRYYTPAGNNIHEVGITPDIVLEYDTESESDNQLEKAIEILED